MEKKQGFWSGIFSSNKDFDTTIVALIIFIVWAGTITAAVTVVLRGMDISPNFRDILNQIENLLLMITSYLFTKSRVQNGDNNGQTKSH